MEDVFTKYKQELSSITDKLSLKEAIRSSRTGSRKFRDNFVLLKMAWTESLSYFNIIQAVIIYTALVPNSIENINAVLSALQIPFQFPVGASSVLSIIVLMGIMLFGLVSYRFFGLARRANEVSALYSPGQLLLFKKIDDIERKIEELKNERHGSN